MAVCYGAGMKLFGAIAVHVKGEAILATPGFLDKVRMWFGGKPRDTGRVRAAIRAAAVVDSARDALRSIGVTNAVALVVDGTTLFHDKDGRADDLGDLFLAFHEHSAALDDGFDLIRLTVEHVEAGLHMVLELQARSEHPASEPAMRLVCSGRIQDLEPRPGESADAYRARIEPLTKDATGLEVARVQFEAFVARVRDALQKTMPEADAEVVTAQARIARPGADGKEQPAPAQSPTDRNYDPYMAYYPSPMSSMLNIMMWGSIFSMMHTPNVVVVNAAGVPTGHASDPGIASADPAQSEYAESADGGAGEGGVFGDDAGGDVGGGDLGGGDVGGGDGGGFDFGDFGGFD